MASQPGEPDWQAVIARSLAYIALHKAELGNADLGAQAMFLMGLGLSRAEAAAMLGTSADSLGILIKRKKGRRRAKAKS